MRGGGERGAEGEGWGLREEEGGREGTGQERGDTKRQMNGWEREGGGGRSAGRKRSGRGVGGEPHVARPPSANAQMLTAGAWKAFLCGNRGRRLRNGDPGQVGAGTIGFIHSPLA